MHGNNFRCKILRETRDPALDLIAICQDGRLWYGHVWLRIETSEGLLRWRRQIFGLERMLGLFWVAERLLASEVVICCMKFVTVSFSRLSGWRQIKGLSLSLFYCKQLSHSLLQTRSFCSLMSLHSVFFRTTISQRESDFNYLSCASNIFCNLS